ncbi:Z1 domain-containing protein [uncultured Candidatus Kuenenia sp.]|uniref:Z1 domain-containing protein n=1 Tax=uncultured Candidatus Kuenenia sp. TaxID=1048336 RepID=UPI0025DDC482|nr:Z1 domain-containing protein [uncultured Candidatus Kuenenia sp.]
MIEQAKNICIELLRKIRNPSSQNINSSIDNVLKIFPDLVSERETLFNYLAATFSVFSEVYRILDTDEGYTPWLKDAKASIQWNFWNRYISYLQKKIAPDTINKLDNLTDDILDRIANPSTPGTWDKRGMVVGQVQSGKTSNYTGLINKAGDAGYKLIIVMAGMHDSLRSQTQIRIDEGFLGFNSQRSLQYSNTNKIGVGFYNPLDGKTNQPIDLPANALTSSHLSGDFNRRVAQSAGIHLKSSDPIVAVVKKNGSILKNSISWLAVWGDKQSDGKIIIRNIPFLLIDDEADNASINVSKEKVSAINGCIRALLSLFEQSSYVGYTATPFANIFIPILGQESVKGLDLTIKDYEFVVGQDLFPKDFVINIPAPSNYIGPAKIFGLPALTSSDANEESLPVIRLVEDYEALVPDEHKKNDPLPEELPNSLKFAIKCFILSAAARRVRKQIDVHNSMLIHISRFIVWQDRIASLVDAELKFYQKQIELKSGNLLKELQAIWKKEFEPTTTNVIRDSHIYSDPEITPIAWNEVKAEIYSAISKMEVRAVHGEKNIAGLSHHNISPLDYFFSEQQGKFLSVIAVGGNKLSRGLTLEGLTVSYYLRASKMYDTLMQMGRWFGYRPGYVDLCRIFTSNELTKWYKHITIASEEMRRDFDYMFLLKKTPKEFGLKVRTHPGVLKITATNKFRYKKIMYLSYSGQLEQTYQFKLDNGRFRKNFDATNELIGSLGKPIEKPFNDYNKKQIFVWRGENNFNVIAAFLQKYKIGEEVLDTNKIVDYITAQTKEGYLVNWTVALINNSTAKPEDEFSFSGLTEKVGLTDRTNISNDSMNYEVTKYNITDHRHELIDLSEDEVLAAIAQTEADYKEAGKKEIPELPSRKRIKWRRDSKKGLLLIYPLNGNCLHATGERKKLSNMPIIGIAISFPEIENDEKIEYAVNEQFRKEYEYPDELDQQDENEGTD